MLPLLSSENLELSFRLSDQQFSTWINDTNISNFTKVQSFFFMTKEELY